MREEEGSSDSHGLGGARSKSPMLAEGGREAKEKADPGDKVASAVPGVVPVRRERADLRTVRSK